MRQRCLARCRQCSAAVLATGFMVSIFITWNAIYIHHGQMKWRRVFGTMDDINISSNTSRNISTTIKSVKITTVTTKRTNNTTTTKQIHDNFINITTTSLPVRHRICYVSLHGGLGNSMFQYAAVVGVALSKNMRPMVHTEDHVYKTFAVTEETFRTKDNCTRFKVQGEGTCCIFDNVTNVITGDNDIWLHGYRQSWMYFHQHEESIRKKFTFRKEITDVAVLTLQREIKTQLKRDYNANILIQKGSKQHQNVSMTFRDVTLVGIHVRRGDIVTHAHFIDYGYLVPPVEYFHHAMAAFRSNYSDVIFIVCSNDQQWSREQLRGPDVVFITPVSAAVDMAVLSLCDHVIMSVGTYGWWAGFLAGGTVIYYGQPVREDSALRKQYSKEMTEFFYPHWIKMF